MSSPDTARRSAGQPSFSLVAFALLAGPLVWAIHFGVIYIVHAVVCVAPDLAALATALIVGLTVVAGVLIVGLTVSRYGPIARVSVSRAHAKANYATMGLGLGVLSLAAVIWEASAALILSACTLWR